MTAEQHQAMDKPHYTGHRDRLRQRFIDSGPDALHDYEVLELLLFSAIPRKDVKPLAKALLAKFGNLQKLLQANLEELTNQDGISQNTAVLLKTVNALSNRMMKQELMDRPVLKNWNKLRDYCQQTMAHEPREYFRVMFLNKRNELIADEIQNAGTVDHAPVYPREIMKRALELGATALVLVHNHPSGDTKPSKLDIDMTRKVVRAAEPFSILVHDHLIIGTNSIGSFKELGLL